MNSVQQLFQRPGYEVRVSGLYKSYRTGEATFQALNGISCVVPSGHVTVTQGPSGCGKTTLMNVVGGVDTADRGTVTVGDTDLTNGADERQLARYRLNEVGFIFQAFNLIPGLTALDNLHLPMTVAGKSRVERDHRGRALLKLVGMDNKADKRPDALSGGEQQRVAIALALVNDPPLILADEPTGNLDSRNAEIVADLLCSLAHDFGKTVILTTHDPAIGERGDQRLRMRDGVFEQS